MNEGVISPGERPLGAQIWRYVATGLINTCLGLAIIVVLHVGLDVGVIAANAFGYGAGLLVSFALNRAWTFASQKSVLSTGVAYIAVVGVAFGSCILLIIVSQAVGAPYLVAQLLGTVVYSVLVFIGAKYLVFSR